jgi:hypothetical protein
VSASVRVGIGDGEGDGFGLGGSEALTFLAEVSFGGGQRLGQVLFDKFAGETGPSGEESGVDSFDPGRWQVNLVIIFLQTKEIEKKDKENI